MKLFLSVCLFIQSVTVSLAQSDDPFANPTNGAEIPTTPPDLAPEQIELSKSYFWQDRAAVWIRTPVALLNSYKGQELNKLSQKYIDLFLAKNADKIDHFENPEKYIEDGTFKSVNEILDEQINFQNELDGTLSKLYQTTQMRGTTQMTFERMMGCSAYYVMIGLRATKTPKPTAEGGISEGVMDASAVGTAAANSTNFFGKFFGFVSTGVSGVLRPMIPNGFWVMYLTLPVQYIRIDKLGKDAGKMQTFYQPEHALVVMTNTDLLGYDDANGIVRAGYGCIGGRVNTLSQVKGALFGASFSFNPVRAVASLGKTINKAKLTKWADDRKWAINFNAKIGVIQNELKWKLPDMNYKHVSVSIGKNFTDGKVVKARLNYGFVFNIFNPSGFDMSDMSGGIVSNSGGGNPFASMNANTKTQFAKYVANTNGEREMFLAKENQGVYKKYSGALVSHLFAPRVKATPNAPAVAFNPRMHTPLDLKAGMLEKISNKAKAKAKRRDA